jgi:hypothetical protein
LRRSLATQKILAALQSGDATPLIQFHRTHFGDARMQADDAGGDDGGGDGGGDDDDDDAGGDGSGKGDTADKDLDPRVKELSDENAKHRNLNKELKKQNADLAARLKALEDKDKSEAEKATSTAKELEAKAKQLEETNQRLLVQNAFLTDNKYTWANPKTALKLVDLSDVEINDDGEVTGMREALDKLAKAEPYLLAKNADDGDDDGDDGKGKPPPTGVPQGKKPKGNPDREKLLMKYPALRR